MEKITILVGTRLSIQFSVVPSFMQKNMQKYMQKNILSQTMTA